MSEGMDGQMAFDQADQAVEGVIGAASQIMEKASGLIPEDATAQNQNLENLGNVLQAGPDTIQAGFNVLSQKAGEQAGETFGQQAEFSPYGEGMMGSMERLGDMAVLYNAANQLGDFAKQVPGLGKHLPELAEAIQPLQAAFSELTGGYDIAEFGNHTGIAPEPEPEVEQEPAQTMQHSGVSGMTVPMDGPSFGGGGMAA